MKFLLSLIIFLLSMVTVAQVSEPIAMNTNIDEVTKVKESIKTFSNSESAGISFIISSDLKKNTLVIKTNYEELYKVRLIGYMGSTQKVFKDLYSDNEINVADFNEEIFIMNISDARDKKLLTSQVINLKRRKH